MRTVHKIAFAGTFDPVTEGHLWVVNEALALADEVIIFIAENAGKSPMFNVQKRTEIFNNALIEKGWSDRCRVIPLRSAYVARAAKKYGADYLIRGIRSTVDFDYENQLQQANTDVLDGVKTIFVMPPRDLGSVSSSYIKGYVGPAGWHWYVSEFLPRSAYTSLIDVRLRFYWDTFVSKADGFSEYSSNTFENLIEKYNDTNRTYHNKEHLLHMLDEMYAHPEFEKLSSNMQNDLVFSGFGHDIIQGGPNDVPDSIYWLEQYVYVNENVKRLILKTDHTTAPSSVDESILLSADLSILGQDEDRYDTYSCSVREEYKRLHPHISKDDFNKGRRKVLDYFINLANTDKLFHDSHFSFLYNQQAIENMYRELHSLDS